MTHRHNKKIYRSKERRFLSGVLGGLAEYFVVDVTILRLLTVLIALVTGIIPTAFVYICAVLIIPEKPQTTTYDEHGNRIY